MKPLIQACLSLIAAQYLSAHPQLKHLEEAYSARGNALIEAFYWLPETRESVVKHIPQRKDGLDPDAWRGIPKEEHSRVLEEVALILEQVNSTDKIWKRIWDWQSLRSQIALLTTFLDSEEGLVDLAYHDPVLRPAYKWITDKRSPNFDPKCFGSTLSACELQEFYPVLVRQLLDTSEHERLECFSRLFARIAERKTPGQDK